MRAPGAGRDAGAADSAARVAPRRRGPRLSAALRADGSLAPARGRLAVRAAET